MKAKYIVFEGNDGCGKGTQINLFLERLKKKGITNVLSTHQPWKNGLRAYIRKRILEGASANEVAPLFLIDRFFQYLRQIGPALKKGYVVISDRENYSTEAYQIPRGFSEKAFKLILKIGDVIRIKRPDICFIIDVPAKVSLYRLKKSKRTEEHIKYEKSVSELELTRKTYLKIVKKYPECVLINGLGSPKEVSERIWEKAKRIL